MFDVFISYGHQDQAWVRTLAENLYRAGLEVFYDEWEIGPGDVLVHRLDEGIRTSRSGMLVVSPASLARPWVMEEYAAMLTRAVADQQRLIPVLLGEAELPPFLATRVWVDFRHADGPRTSRSGMLVVSPVSLDRPWVAEEYAAMLNRAVAGQQRLIPVLLGEAELPPFLAARVWVDFRHADGPEYERRVSHLVAALR